MTETVLSSASKEVVIGFEQPFCIIGERINPTGRKQLAAQMATGDYRQVEADALAQVAAGAHMLDVNAGIPLADEPRILAETIRLVQSLVEVPLSIDSSIVAASLANGRTPFSLATFTTRDPLGDEREYAEAVADTVRHPLHEAMREVGRIDPDRSTAARMPRPSGRLFEQESARIASEIAARVGARAIVTGGGGDNVFCSLQSAAPVADRLLAEGPGRGTFETAREIGRFASASLPAVVYMSGPAFSSAVTASLYRSAVSIHSPRERSTTGVRWSSSALEL